MESQFAILGVAKEITKFQLLVSALQPEELSIVGGPDTGREVVYSFEVRIYTIYHKYRVRQQSSNHSKNSISSVGEDVTPIQLEIRFFQYFSLTFGFLRSAVQKKPGVSFSIERLLQFSQFHWQSSSRPQNGG
ncbi:hypothetical protein NPIL_168391 [Nephila pilipes]|uniref:Uncharacterized protein n=1 Tax=Nephila pilipes TaxID=299642 RepID=A0A8X6TPK5_NEPPI|nr:hypothetical protein NPIL_168391 [Nephila pilipes]